MITQNAMKKKILISFLVLAGISAGLIGSKFFFNNQEQENAANQLAQEEAIDGAEFALQFINSFLGNLDESYLIANSSTLFAEKLTDNILATHFTTLKNLGSLRQITSIQTDEEKPDENTSSLSSVYLVLETEFENNVATFYIELSREEGNWKINNFNILSPIIII